MKKVPILILAILVCSIVKGQNKAEYEKNGIKVNFLTTQLGTIVNDEFEFHRDMNISGVFIFLPDKKAVVIRHENDNDELLKVISVKKTPELNFVFECDKNRVLFVSPTNRLVTYTIEGNSSVFIFPIMPEDVELLKIIANKY